ncbi:MAG: PEP/pyruvate-binding domain-containing protein [Elusimicrobiota bacterium]
MRWLRSWFSGLGKLLSPGGERQDFLRELQDALGGPQDPSTALKALHEKFAHFTRLLERNNQVLKVMSDLEEKAQGDYLFDINYIRSSLAGLREGLKDIIESMVALGGADYAPLRGRYAAIDREIGRVLSGDRPIEKDDFIVPFAELRADRDWSVGAKAAGLGEMKALGLPVPEGFAVSAWAYKRFQDANGLNERLAGRLKSLDVKSLDELREASRRIRELVASSPVPEDLAEALRRSAAGLAERSPSGSFSLRSSAIGEDSALSFAGQYETLLNVRPEEVVERYRDVLAGQFTPRAIYYFLSHSLSESRLAMCVAAVSMVDAAASGVVYTRDPVSPDDGSLLVSAIRGQGRYLVDGTLTPDMFRISRDDLSVRESRPAGKPVRLVMRPGGGMVREAVPERERELPSLAEGPLKELARMCLRIEDHSGGPRDIEWALDREGRLFLLQNRPLRVFRRGEAGSMPDVSRFEALASGGTTVCPGAGCGPVCFVSAPDDLPRVPEGAVLAATHPFPEIVTVMGRVRAIVSRVGGVASHMATLAREYRIPTVVLDPGGIEPGAEVTVDATAGTVYAGLCRDLIEARQEEGGSLEDEAIIALARRLLARISPLNLLHPTDPGFAIASCRTFHDITRFAHQRAMEEMFSSGRDIKDKGKLGLRLRSEVPLPVVIIYLDRDLAAGCRGRGRGKRSVDEDDIRSEPMRAFWAGIRKEGWPKPPAVDARGFMSVVGTHLVKGQRAEFSESSYALLGREYMLVSLRMGYHFTTVEAMCTTETSKNYIRMQYKQGGASPERRLRRIRLIEALLGRMGFTSTSRGDFLDASLSYQSREDIARKLVLLGRLNIMTKQLDMALGSDAIAEWYLRDLAGRLGLGMAPEGGA